MKNPIEALTEIIDMCDGLEEQPKDSIKEGLARDHDQCITDIRDLAETTLKSIRNGIMKWTK